MGGAVTIGRLMKASGDMPEWRWESARDRGSNYECLDNSPGPEVLALFVGVRCTELSRREEVAPGVVNSLRVSYLR